MEGGSTPILTPILTPCIPTSSHKRRFDAGSGMATIRHPTPLRLGEYHTVRLFRNLTRGSLVVDGLSPVNGTSQVRGGQGDNGGWPGGSHAHPPVPAGQVPGAGPE